MATITSGNIGNLHTSIVTSVDESSVKLSTQKIQQTLETASEAQREAQARNAASHVVGTYGKMGSRIQELGRGFEDFAVSFSMAKTTSEGIAMGLRGSANNAAQLAASFNPIAGAAVAIGASLATIIVPQMMKWLGTMYEVNRELKEYEKTLEDIEKKAGGQAKFSIEAGNINTLESLQKKLKDKADERKVAEAEVAALMKEQVVAQTQLAKAQKSEEAFARRTIFESKLFAYTERYLSGKSGQVAQAKPEAEAANKAVRDKQSDLARIGREAKELEGQLGRVSIEEDAKHEDEFNKWVAVRDNDLRKDNAKHEDEFNKWVYYQKEQRRKDELKAMDEKFAFMEAAEKQFLDDQITSQTESIDILQERIQKAGNAAGPSAAFVTGTQAAESAINRAISGTRSVEDTMKAQLKVQQDMLKALNKQKQQLTTKAI